MSGPGRTPWMALAALVLAGLVPLIWPGDKLEPREGRVALWVGPGTEGYFANLKISAK